MTLVRPRLIACLLPLALAACETSTPPPSAAQPPPTAATPAKGAPAPTMTPIAQNDPPAPAYEARVDPLAIPKFNSLGVGECDDYLEAARQCLNSHQLTAAQYKAFSNTVNGQMGRWHLGKHDAETCINARAEAKVAYSKACLNL